MDPPGYPGGSPCATQGTVIRSLRHLTPNQDILEGWTYLDIQGVTLCDARDVHTPFASLTPNQDILEGWVDLDILEGWVNLDIQEGHLMRCEGR